MDNNGQIVYNSKDFLTFSKEFKVNLINSLSGYKSVNLIGTQGRRQISNLAIFNTIIHVGSNPPLMGLLIRPPAVVRDTLDNIRETGQFTINHIHPRFYTRAHQTAARYYTDRSEFEIVGLTPFFTEKLKAPYVEESPVKIGLELKEELVVKSNSSVFIVGEVIEIILPKKAVLADGFIDLGITGTLTSSGLDAYYSTQKIARLSFAKPDTDLNIIG